MASIQAEMTAFAARTTPGKFPGFPRAEISSGLIDRKNQPSLIDQGKSSLCGPAALMFHVASEDFETYARYVMNLYDHGAARLGKLWIRPSRGCRNNTPSRDEIPGIDWIALASLRDSQNTIRNYDDVSDKIPGITEPDMLARWYRKLGWDEADEFASWVTVRPLSQLIDCDFWFAKGHKVSIFTKGSLVKNGGPDFWDLTMDPTGRLASHWVALTSRIRIDNTRAAAFNDMGDEVDDIHSLHAGHCEFEVFTWGGTRVVSQPTHIVLSYFHGAVIT